MLLAAYRQIRPNVPGAVLTDCAADAELRSRYLETLIKPARRAAGLTLDRATARGDRGPDTDRELLLDMVSSLIHYPALFAGRHIPDAEAGAAIETRLRGAALDYDALLEHSLAIEHDAHARGEDHLHHGA